MSKKNTLLIILGIFLIVVLTSCELLMKKPAKPNVKVLLVALDYRHNSEIVLNGTIRDAKEFKQALAELNPNIPDSSFVEMYQEGPSPDTSSSTYPTVNNVLTEIDKQLNDLEENDLFIFYYAGHGVDYVGDLALAVPGGGGLYHPLSAKVLLEKFSNIEKGHAVLILDSCYSGQYVPSYDFLDEYYNPNLLVIAASSPDKKSYEGNFPVDGELSHRHGFFTYYLLESLGWDHDGGNLEKSSLGIITQVRGELKTSPVMHNGTITFSSIFRYIRKHNKAKRPFIVRGPIDKVLYSEKW